MPGKVGSVAPLDYFAAVHHDRYVRRITRGVDASVSDRLPELTLMAEMHVLFRRM